MPIVVVPNREVEEASTAPVFAHSGSTPMLLEYAKDSPSGRQSRAARKRSMFLCNRL